RSNGQFMAKPESTPDVPDLHGFDHGGIYPAQRSKVCEHRYQVAA
ncbi:MAG: hypothetical protein RLZZ527_283, partial [Actinomycetota bacterium]